MLDNISDTDIIIRKSFGYGEKDPEIVVFCTVWKLRIHTVEITEIYYHQKKNLVKSTMK